MARIAGCISLLATLACSSGSENDSAGSETTSGMPGTSSGSGSTSDAVDSSTGARGGTDSPLDDSTSSTSAAPTTDATDDGGTTTGTDSSSSTGDADVTCTRPPAITTCDALDKAPPPTAFQAFGVGCPGDPASTVPLVTEAFGVDDPETWGVFGTLDDYVDPKTGTPLWAPRQGGAMLALSTGQFNGDDLTGNPDFRPLPNPITIPVVALDLAYLQFTVAVPEGVHGFAIDVMLYSEGWGSDVAMLFDDGLVVWEESDSVSGNICIGEDSFCSVTSLWPTAFQPGAPDGWNPGALGVSPVSAGATGWMELQGSAVPGEDLQITIALFDAGNASTNTVALIDGFRWMCEAP